MSGRKKAKSQFADGVNGRFFLLPHALLDSEAFRTASDRAIKVLVVICRHHNGFNNGRIGVSIRELAHGMGTQNFAGFTKAIGELCDRGIIEQTSRHPHGKRLSREFRLTFMPTDSGPATNDYLNWRAGDPGTVRKKSVANVATDNGIFVATTATDAKLTAASTATDKNENDGNPSFSVDACVATASTLISNHGRDRSPHARQCAAIADGPRGTARTKLSSAPASEELRARTREFLGSYGRGWQGRLAEQAGIPAPTLSRFLRHDGPLSEAARVQLACAFPRTEAAARREAKWLTPPGPKHQS